MSEGDEEVMFVILALVVVAVVVVLVLVLVFAPSVAVVRELHCRGSIASHLYHFHTVGDTCSGSNADSIENTLRAMSMAMKLGSGFQVAGYNMKTIEQGCVLDECVHWVQNRGFGIAADTVGTGYDAADTPVSVAGHWQQHRHCNWGIVSLSLLPPSPTF